MFQSAPAIAGGRSQIAGGTNAQIRAFQSAPAIAGGRSAIAKLRALIYQRFNPRPPLLAGDPRPVR